MTASFFLYVTEDTALGFAATAVATQLRRSDVGPAEIGAVVASFCLPSQLGLPTVVRLVQDSFGAMQDVAIDALAVITLHEEQRGLANGHRRTAV